MNNQPLRHRWRRIADKQVRCTNCGAVQHCGGKLPKRHANRFDPARGQWVRVPKCNEAKP